jgi:hypothetical protein
MCFAFSLLLLGTFFPSDDNQRHKRKHAEYVFLQTPALRHKSNNSSCYSPISNLHSNPLHDTRVVQLIQKDGQADRTPYNPDTHANVTNNSNPYDLFIYDLLHNAFNSQDNTASICKGSNEYSDGLGTLGRGMILLFSTASEPTLGIIRLPIQRVPWALSPEVKRPGSEGDYSPPSCVKFKNGGAISPLPNMSSWQLKRLSERQARPDLMYCGGI